MKKHILFPLLTLLLSPSLMSKTLIVSDIDDTIKRTNVLGTGILTGGLGVRNSFQGLSHLYTSILCQGLEGATFDYCINNKGMFHKEEIVMAYVTGAPGSIHSVGREFLQISQFPNGLFLGRPDMGINTKEFKISAISEMIEASEDVTDVILIGDNGEYDPEAYHEVTKRFPNINFVTYIHTVYNRDKGLLDYFSRVGSSLAVDQIPYLSAVDLGIDFVSRGLIKEDDLKRVFDHVMLYATSFDEDTFEQLIPEWVACDYFNEIYKRPQIELQLISEKSLELYNRHVTRLCNFED